MIPPAALAPPADRPTDLRMAHVHLRMGALELARAELESFAGRGVLDAQALLDLAEARWRTGDLPGAGVAASAYLGSHDPQVLALVIAAEAAAGVGHPGDARRLAQEALDLLEEAARARPEAATGAEALDTVFAGMPQSAVWPLRPHFRVEPAGLLFVAPAAGARRVPEAVAEAASPTEDRPGEVAAAGLGATVRAAGGEGGGHPADAESLGPGFWAEPIHPEPSEPHPVELAEARTALEAGDPAAAAARLGELLRRRPDLAGPVLAALGQAPPEAQEPAPTAGRPDPSDPTSRPSPVEQELP